MKILIFGGTGAMGVPLVKLLGNDKGNEVYVQVEVIILIVGIYFIFKEMPKQIKNLLKKFS